MILTDEPVIPNEFLGAMGKLEEALRVAAAGFGEINAKMREVIEDKPNPEVEDIVNQIRKARNGS